MQKNPVSLFTYIWRGSCMNIFRIFWANKFFKYFFGFSFFLNLFFILQKNHESLLTYIWRGSCMNIFRIFWANNFLKYLFGFSFKKIHFSFCRKIPCHFWPTYEGAHAWIFSEFSEPIILWNIFLFFILKEFIFHFAEKSRVTFDLHMKGVMHEYFQNILSQ